MPYSFTRLTEPLLSTAGQSFAPGPCPPARTPVFQFCMLCTALPFRLVFELRVLSPWDIYHAPPPALVWLTQLLQLRCHLLQEALLDL